MAALTGAILAGGLSTRMGRDKATLQLAGAPLAARAAAALRPLCSEILLVGSGTFPLSGCRSVPDAHPRRSSLTGLYSALLASDTPLVLVVACDYPFVGQDLLRRLIAAWRPGLLGVMPLGPDGRHPLLALYHRSLAPRLLQSLDAGRLKIQSALDPSRLAHLPWASLKRLGVRPQELWNLNTQEDLARARQFLEGTIEPEDQDGCADHQ